MRVFRHLLQHECVMHSFLDQQTVSDALAIVCNRNPDARPPSPAGTCQRKRREYPAAPHLQKRVPSKSSARGQSHARQSHQRPSKMAAACAAASQPAMPIPARTQGRRGPQQLQAWAGAAREGTQGSANRLGGGQYQRGDQLPAQRLPAANLSPCTRRTAKTPIRRS